MISVLHLIWIIPLATLFGFMIAAIFAVGGDRNTHHRPSKQ